MSLGLKVETVKTEKKSENAFSSGLILADQKILRKKFKFVLTPSFFSSVEVYH